MDVLTAAQRQLNMARVRGRDTKPEWQVRRDLHRAGFRYRLHIRALPGRPDLALPRHRTVIFVHGCFWHGHSCRAANLPATRTDFWRAKIDGNRARDVASTKALIQSGWRVFTVWECALRGRARQPLGVLVERLTAWLRSGELRGELAALDHGAGFPDRGEGDRAARLPPTADTEYEAP